MTEAQLISPKAVISPEAKLGKGVSVGAYAVVGAGVELGEGCVLHPHAMLIGPRSSDQEMCSQLLRDRRDPQDYTYAKNMSNWKWARKHFSRRCDGQSRNEKGGVQSRGSGLSNFFLAYSHVGHDCQVGSNTLFINGATLAGHVTVQDYVTVGAFSPMHQFCRLGRYAYIGACTVDHAGRAAVFAGGG